MRFRMLLLEVQFCQAGHLLLCTTTLLPCILRDRHGALPCKRPPRRGAPARGEVSCAGVPESEVGHDRPCFLHTRAVEPMGVAGSLSPSWPPASSGWFALQQQFS